ncbi:transportin MOS14 [Tanacetum coccineum]
MKILHRPHVFTIAVVTFIVFTMSPSQSRSLSPIGYLVNAIHITFGQGCLYFQSCLTVGAYTKWIGGAPSGFSFLPSVIGILVSGISMSEDSVVAAALAFRTFVMIRWVEERIVEGSIEGSVVHIQGGYYPTFWSNKFMWIRRTFLFHSRDNFCGSSLSSCLLEPFMPLFSIEVLKLQADPFTLRLSHRPLNTQGSEDYDQTEDYVEARDYV